MHRVYELSFDDGVLRIWRDEPGFSPRFEGPPQRDGDTIAGIWKLSREDSTWDDDLAITFRRT